MNQLQWVLNRRRHAVALGAVIFAAGCIDTTAYAQDPPCYEVTGILFGPDCLGYPAMVEAWTINNNGEIAGSYTCLGPNLPFLWQGGPLIPLPRPPGVAQASCYDLEDDGRIAGTMGQWSSPRRGFLYENGEMVALDPLPGDYQSSAGAMSVAGRVVGSSKNTSGPRRAVFWESGAITPLDLPVGPNSAAFDVNDDGSVIVGWMGQAVGQNCSVFLWENGEAEDRGSLFGGPAASPWAVNNNRVIVGQASVEAAPGEFIPHAFVWQDGIATDLGVLPGFAYSYAYDVNDDNVIVGQCRVSRDRLIDHATLWIDGVMYDLNDVIQPQPDLMLMVGEGVNDEGQIVAKGYILGEVVGVLLTPVVADLNGDCIVNVEDLLILLGEWSCSNSPADFNNDGTVNVLDLLILLAQWTV